MYKNVKLIFPLAFRLRFCIELCLLYQKKFYGHYPKHVLSTHDKIIDMIKADLNIEINLPKRDRA